MGLENTNLPTNLVLSFFLGEGGGRTIFNLNNSVLKLLQISLFMFTPALRRKDFNFFSLLAAMVF